MQPDLTPKEKPGAMFQHHSPGFVSTPAKEYQHADNRAIQKRNLSFIALFQWASRRRARPLTQLTSWSIDGNLQVLKVEVRHHG
jgi:hypothetical protein